MTNWHKLKRHLTTALDNPPPHTDKATIAQVLFLMATMEESNVPQLGGGNPMTITPEEIAEWRKVCEEATEEPWEYEAETTKSCAVIDPRVAMFIPLHAPIEADSTFITTARTAMPRLLDELAAKDALIAKLVDALEGTNVALDEALGDVHTEDWEDADKKIVAIMDNITCILKTSEES